MKKAASLILCSLVLVALTWGVGSAQMFPRENHYLVYENGYDTQFTAQVMLTDQFTGLTVNQMFLDKFATPVEKEHDGVVSEVYDSFRHHDWWKIYQNEPIREVELDNQFGLQKWLVQDLQFLLVPAIKNNEADILAPANHYMCYDAVGPRLDNLQVNLTDQFESVTTMVHEPAFFCNPAEKVDPAGNLYPIEDPEAHLACYLVDSMGFMIQALTEDQFGFWDLELLNHELLCVPTWKLSVTAAEESTWGQIKSRY